MIFGALVSLLAEELADDADRLNLRSLAEQEDGARRDFERLPLDDSGVAYVALADVASYYEYVDHEHLSRDIVDWTADVDLSDAIESMLGALQGRRFGLPQGPRASDLLADLYLSAVDRDLDRAGIKAWRYNDDFVVGAKTDRHARLYLRNLEAGLRLRGLVLNHEKSRVTSRTTYEEWIDSLTQRLAEAAIDNIDVGAYSFDPVEFAEVDIENVDVDAAEALFEQAMDDEEPDPYRVNGRILQQTLPVLAKNESQAPLRRLDELSTRWSTYARHISLYLREFIGTDGEAKMALEVAKLLRSEDTLIPWVRGWLLDPLARCDRRIALRNWKPEMIAWFASEQVPWFLRGRAALVLAQRGEILDQEEFDLIFQRAPAAARADLVASVRLADPEWAEKWLAAIGPDQPLLTEVADLDPDDWAAVL